jgi:hypothetical protein
MSCTNCQCFTCRRERALAFQQGEEDFFSFDPRQSDDFYYDDLRRMEDDYARHDEYDDPYPYDDYDDQYDRWEEEEWRYPQERDDWWEQRQQELAESANFFGGASRANRHTAKRKHKDGYLKPPATRKMNKRNFYVLYVAVPQA